jgi:hypothetical protein
MDPAFASAVCRYDLSEGPLKLTVPVSPAYTSVSFYTRYDVAYYAINDRAAGRRVIELDLMTARPAASKCRKTKRSPLPTGLSLNRRHRLVDRHPCDGAGAGINAGRTRRRRGIAMHAANRTGTNQEMT